MTVIPAEPLAAIVVAGLGAFGVYWANRVLGRAAFQTAINNGFESLTKSLQAERQTLQTELEEERAARVAERAILQRELEDERIKSAAERAQLRGEIINLTQTIESLKEQLRRKGFDWANTDPIDADTPAPQSGPA